MPENAMNETAAAPGWTSVDPLTALARAAPPASTSAGADLIPIVPGRLKLLVARRDAQAAATEAITAATGIAPPQPGRVARTGNAALIWSAPGQWLLLSDEEGAAPDLDPDLVAATDQTGGRVLVRIGGPRARDALAKLLTIDLHPRVFADDAAATTSAAGIGVVIWRDGEGFVIASGRSTAADLWRQLAAASAEYA